MIAELHSLADLDAAIARSQQQPLLIFKHSTV